MSRKDRQRINQSLQQDSKWLLPPRLGPHNYPYQIAGSLAVHDDQPTVHEMQELSMWYAVVLGASPRNYTGNKS